MRRAAILLLVLVIACKEKPQPAETNTLGNATDRTPATGTTGTGEPHKVATDSAEAAQQLSTAPASGTAVTATEVVHAKKTTMKKH